MSDYRDVLEKSRQQFRPELGGFERLRRRRDRKVRNERIATAVLALIIAAAVIGGAIKIFRSGGKETPATPPKGDHSAVLPLASIGYPSGWFLLDLSASDQTDVGPVLQLSNFDAGLKTIDCQTVDFPIDGAALLVSETGPAAAGTSYWPASLTSTDPAAGSSCPGPLGATWQSATGIGYVAQAFVGDQVSAADRQALVTAFGTLLFPAHPPAQVTSAAGALPRVVLDTGMSGNDPVLLYAYLDDTGALGMGVSGPIQSANPNTPTIYGASSGFDLGNAAPFDITIEGGGTPFAVAYGMVAPSVDRLAFLNDAGDRFPATIVPLPESLGSANRAVWGIVQGITTSPHAVAYDAQGNELGADTNWYPTAPADTIATGNDPVGGPWELTVTHSNLGDGIGLAWTWRGESGSGCCFSNFSDPRRHPLQVFGYSPGDPGTIEAIVSADAASIVFESGGQTVTGRLVPLPEQYLGPAKVALVFVPASLNTRAGDGDLIGDLVAYDAHGAEIASAFIGPGNQPPVPTAEIGAVWQSLARAWEAVSAYGSEHPLTELDASTLSSLEPYVQWNLGTVVVPGQVTVGLESTSPDIGGDVLLRAATASGDTYCVAVLIDEKTAPKGWGISGTYHPVTVRYGHGDATTVTGCRGGWD